MLTLSMSRSSSQNSIALSLDERALASQLHISSTCFLLVSDAFTSIPGPIGLIGTKYSTERKVRLPIGRFLFNNGKITKRRLDAQETDDKEEDRGGDLDPFDDELGFEVVVEVDERGRPIEQSPRAEKAARAPRVERKKREKKVVVERKQKQKKVVVEGKGKERAVEQEEEPMIEIEDEASDDSDDVEMEDEDQEDEEDEGEAQRRAAESLATLFLQKIREGEASRVASVEASLKGGNNNDQLSLPPPKASQSQSKTSKLVAPLVASSSRPAVQQNASASTSSFPVQPPPPAPQQPMASSSKLVATNGFPSLPSSKAVASSSNPLILNPLVLPPSPSSSSSPAKPNNHNDYQPPPSNPNQPIPTIIPHLVYASLHLQTYRSIIKNISRLQPELYPMSNGEKWKAAVMKVLNGDKRIRRKGLDRFTWKYGRGPGSRWDV